MRRDWKEYNTQLVKRGQTHNHNTSKQKSFVKALFKQTGISIDLSNFRTIHYRHSREDLHLRHTTCSIGLIEIARKKAEAVSCKVKEVIAYTGYDTHEIFRYLGNEGIKSVIKVRRRSAMREKAGRGGKRGIDTAGGGM